MPPTDKQTTDAETAAYTIGEVQPHDAPIRLAEYDTEWATLFQREAKRIRECLGGSVLQLEHVGSTSVPGLAAKTTDRHRFGRQTLHIPIDAGACGARCQPEHRRLLGDARAARDVEPVGVVALRAHESPSRPITAVGRTYQAALRFVSTTDSPTSSPPLGRFELSGEMRLFAGGARLSQEELGSSSIGRARGFSTSA